MVPVADEDVEWRFVDLWDSHSMGLTGDDGHDERQPARNPAWDRIVDQLAWYSRKSTTAQQAYKRVKLGQLIVGAAVPVVAALQVSAAVTATLAALVVIAEGAQQLYQWQTNWVLYRATAESLKHEKYLYLATAGPYSAGDRDRVLAERIEGLVSQEHAKWTEARYTDSQTSSGQFKHG